MQFMLIFTETPADVAQRHDPEAVPGYWCLERLHTPSWWLDSWKGFGK